MERRSLSHFIEDLEGLVQPDDAVACISSR
jgi:hypothetical protein